MATSGSKNFNIDVSDAIEEAYERCGVEVRTGYQAKTARRSLNLMLAEWANRGLNLFTIEQVEIDTETIDFIFLGNIGLNDDMYSLAYQYIRNVSFGSRETQFVYRDPEQKPKYGYDHFTLLNTF